ncbi:MAG: alpha/beta fold hydrolase [Flavobacteriaceae bacterium]
MQEKTFYYKNIKINYSSSGKGPVVVLLHGFLENKTMWQEIVPSLAQKNRVITIDLLGHGKTDNLSYVHTMEAQAKMIKAMLNHLKLRRYFIIGHSLGGYIALAFAELFPKTIKGLCLMNSTALPDTFEKKINRERAIAMVKKNATIFIKLAIPNLFTSASRLKHKTSIEAIKEQALLTTKQGVIASLEGMKIRKDRSFIYHNSAFKTTLIIGKTDPLLSYNSLLSQVKNTKVDIIEFSNGHMSHVENTQELIVEFLQFLK